MYLDIKDINMNIRTHTHTHIHIFWSLPACAQVKRKRTKKSSALCVPHGIINGIKFLLSCTSLLIFT